MYCFLFCFMLNFFQSAVFILNLIFFVLMVSQIRAKESKKLEEAMTRCPADEKRTEMLARLPDLARILRSYPLL